MSPAIRFRPIAFNVLNSVSDCSDFELIGPSGEIFLNNCHIPLEDQVVFRQTVNAEALFEPELGYGLEVDILQKSFEWMALEMHLPLEALKDHEAASFVVSARAGRKTKLAVGYGGLLDRGRGFDCFTFHEYKIGQQYKIITTELAFNALPMDEIENDRFVVALYFNNTDATTVTLSDFRLDLH
ncbi:hypothetical protein [Shimia sp.]|uniref:hypothetical protein n=1 Tax=Shimia sp. TaxID=1954381 RepID=UPI003296CD73